MSMSVAEPGQCPNVAVVQGRGRVARIAAEKNEKLGTCTSPDDSAPPQLYLFDEKGIWYVWPGLADAPHPRLTRKQRLAIAFRCLAYAVRAKTAAVISSITSTCQRHDINSQVYLSQLLIGLQDTPVSQLDQWLPDQWKQKQTPPSATSTPPAR